MSRKCRRAPSARQKQKSEGDKGHTGSRASNARRNDDVTDGSRASNARRNGNGTDEKSSEQCATERKRDVPESERKTRNATKRNGGKERSGNEDGMNYVSRPQQKLNQTT